MTLQFCLHGETLFEATDKFFDKVMVNTDDKKLKDNRLKLVKEINQLYVEGIADLSEIHVNRKEKE